MPQHKTLNDLLADNADAEVSITVYLPDGSLLLVNDPENFNVNDGGLWIKAPDRELWFSDIPFYVSDKREKKKKPGFI